MRTPSPPPRKSHHTTVSLAKALVDISAVASIAVLIIVLNIAFSHLGTWPLSPKNLCLAAGVRLLDILENKIMSARRSVPPMPKFNLSRDYAESRLLRYISCYQI